jgi:acetate kinase
MTDQPLLAVNAGSSSVRLDLFSGLRHVKQAHLKGEDIDATAALRAFAEGTPIVRVVAHRVVHGGPRLQAACIVSEEVEVEIRRAVRLAPLHNPIALRWMDASRQVFGAGALQVAAFDTAFYANLPEVSRRYALPKALAERHGARRYGFHGLAHAAMLQRWQAGAGQCSGARVISLQLGAGCSITASRGGEAADTSMGFSPAEGLVMATRCGDLDPGLVTYLQTQEQMTPAQMEDLLNRGCGLLGMAGDADMQRLLARTDPDASAAVDLYCYRARKYVGAYLAALGGADAILFGGGVGENAPEIRARILRGMQWCGIELDEDANRTAQNEARISTSQSGIEVWVIPVDEAQIIASQARELLKNAADHE